MSGPEKPKDTSFDKAPSNLRSEEPGDRKIAVLRRWEWVMALVLSVLVLALIIARTAQAGPLWRDECDSLQLARMPRFADLLANLQYTSFPLLFPATVRGFTALFGTSDISLRCFGLVVGLFFLAVAWYQSRSVDGEVPLLLPALIGLNVEFLTTGLWVRGYGLGSVLIVLAFVLTARFLQQPSGRRLAVLFLVYLASMHCLFFNGALVPAMVLSAVVVLLVRGEWKWMWLLLTAAAVCGLSYLPYLWKLYFGITSWATVLQVPFSFILTARRFLGACGGSHPIVTAAWLSILLLCMGGGVWRLKVVARDPARRQERDMLLFALLAIPLSLLAYYGFLRMVRNVPLQRYFLALLGVMAAAAALIASNVAADFRLRLARMGLVLVAMLTLVFAPWKKISQRQSNIDQIARQVEKDSRPNDLIVVNPWTVGIAFNHYYRGSNRWITVPEIDEHRVHRYDLVQKRMTEFFPLDGVERDVAATLKSGNRVWIVGRIKIESSGRAPLVLTPAPDPQFGWESAAYANAWSQHLGSFLRRHALRIDLVVRKGKDVSDRENMWLLECEGWRY